MTPKQENSSRATQFVTRRGFYLDALKYAETQPIAFGPDNAQLFLETYQRLKSALGHASYTEVSRAMQVSPIEVMQHVKHLHIHSKDHAVRFLNNRNNENVLFKLLSKKS